MIKAIVFDVDGVIVDTEKIHYAAYKEVLKDYNYNLSFSSYKKYFSGKSIKGGLLSLLSEVELTKNTSEKFAEEFAQNKIKTTTKIFMKGIVFYDDTLEFIKRLQNGKTKLKNIGIVDQKPTMAMVTGQAKILLNEVLKHHNLKKAFSVFVTPDKYKHSKPHPECYNTALSLMTIKPEDTLGVEDSPAGVLALNAAKIYSIGLSTTHNKQELQKAKTVTPSLMALVE